MAVTNGGAPSSTLRLGLSGPLLESWIGKRESFSSDASGPDKYKRMVCAQAGCSCGNYCEHRGLLCEDSWDDDGSRCEQVRTPRTC
jgi:hypothetical protein